MNIEQLQVNDSKGHIAGDLLLKRAALALQDTFPDETVYRAGGDEFVIITGRLSDDEIAARLHTLSNTMALGNFSLAVGYCSGEFENIKLIWETADKRMYAEKEAYCKAKAGIS